MRHPSDLMYFFLLSLQIRDANNLIAYIQANIIEKQHSNF